MFLLRGLILSGFNVGCLVSSLFISLTLSITSLSVLFAILSQDLYFAELFRHDGL